MIMNRATPFDRNACLQQLDQVSLWDMVVIGGGATGLGVALDAASRGYKTLLLEQSDFAKATSSRSTKLVHGGVRYLAQGNIRLVYDALHERGILLRNAPHLVKAQTFIIPCFTRWSITKYLIGLTLYDWLSGRFSFGKSGYLSKEEVLALLPGLNGNGLKGGVRYFDGQFDDARLAVNLAQTSAEQGGVLLNYVQVTGLLKTNGKITGVTATDKESGRSYSIRSRTVVNATGVFVDEILQMDTPGRKPLVRPSQGVHLVFHNSLFPAESALMIPETSDGRVLFAVPWHQHVLAGTTDTPLDQHSLEPRALDKEVKFILNTLKQYLTAAPGEKDVLSVFAGLRPLAAPQKNPSSTKEISRDHKLMTSPSGLITITGGKWTTYRKMAEDTVNKAIVTGGLPSAPPVSATLPIHGSTAVSSDDHTAVNRTGGRTTPPQKDHPAVNRTGDFGGTAPQKDSPAVNRTGDIARTAPPPNDHLDVYGTDAPAIRALMNGHPGWNRRLTERLPYTIAEVIWAVRNEMARTVEDVLARRLRMLFLDARAAIEAAPLVADLVAEELHYPAEWKRLQLAEFVKLAKQYLLINDAAYNGDKHSPLSPAEPSIKN